MQRSERRLAAIMFTDMVGFTALGQRDESLSLAILEEQRKLLRPIFARHNGRVVKTMGDAFLVEFANALDAVRCAYDIQRASREFNISQPREQRINLRIGVHLGDVEESEGDISGDAVNVASRIQSLAEGGGVCITRPVNDLVGNKFELPLKSLGMKTLKNVAAPLEVYRMELPWKEEHAKERSTAPDLDPSRIAVLPFTNMSPDPNDSYFADGLTEEIISTLSSVGGLSVISRTSIMGYRGTTKKVKEIGSELEAGSVLEGSFRKAGNRIRVTTQLIAVNNDAHVWAQSYDRNLDDVFAVQTEIAKRVTDALRVRIKPPEIARIDKKPTENANAYALYLRGRFHLNKRGIDDINRAIEYFERAVREDPKFALGYSGLADCHELLSGNFGIDTHTNHEKARTQVAEALRLNPELAEAYTTQGLVLFHDFEFEESEIAFKKAIELKPSYATAHQWYFQTLQVESRWEEALTEIEKALELDPLSLVINLNHAYYYLARRDYDKALELTMKALELDQNNSQAHFQLGDIYGMLKRVDDMKREIKLGTDLMRGGPQIARRIEAVTARFEEDKGKVRRMLLELETHVGESLGPSLAEIAEYYAYLGEVDRAFEYLEKAYSEKDRTLPYVNLRPDFDQVRSDPRFRSLMKRLGLEQPSKIPAGA